MKASIILLLLPLCHTRAAFYLPGVAPVQFEEGQKVDMFVNKMSSVKTQLPFDYYDLNFCKPETVEAKEENLGQVLAGERTETAGYQVSQRDLHNHNRNGFLLIIPNTQSSLQ